MKEYEKAAKRLDSTQLVCNSVFYPYLSMFCSSPIFKFFYSITLRNDLLI